MTATAAPPTTIRAVRIILAARLLSARRDRQLPASPAALAKRVFPEWNATPTLALINDALVDAIENPDRRYIISAPPRSGKSVLVSQVGAVFALMRNPDSKVIVKSYGDELAESHSREARGIIDANADLVGFRVSRDKTSSGRWEVDGRKGGMLAGGITSPTTGFGADLLLVDDPVKGAADADSASTRARVMAEFRSSLMTRLMPGASAVVVMARWHEHDLAGELLADPDGGWTLLNIPAVSEAGIPDALGRPPGVPMTAALAGIDFGAKRREVGTRAFQALYQGAPSSPEGALIKLDWLESHRRAAAPAHPIRTVVAIDPADSGERDAAGIVAASLGPDGVVSLIADATAKMTSEEWAREAIRLAVDVGASALYVEAFASGTTYVRIVREALARMGGAAQHITVSAWPPKGKTRRGDAVTRAAPLLQAIEVGTFRLAGTFPAFEQAAVRWQAGQHCPDAVAAAVIAHDVLAPTTGQSVTFAAPDLTRRLSDRPGLVTARPGLGQPAAAHRTLTRSVRPGGYDPMAYRTRTLRVF